MAQVFHPISNVVSRVSILGGVVVLSAMVYATVVLARSSYVTGQADPVSQAIRFSHRQHVDDLGIDCRFCHMTAEISPSAGMPATRVCMTCHVQIHAESEMLEPVRASLRENRPLVWTRVHDLPDFVHFDHSIHVS